MTTGGLLSATACAIMPTCETSMASVSETDPSMQAVPTAAEYSRTRSKVYGLRIADDPQNPASFLAVCPQHKILGRDLSIHQARQILHEHELGMH